MKLAWRVSYETVKYDTPDGELHKGQYATDGQVYFVRNHPENNYQPEVIDPREDIKWQEKIAGKTQVGILPEKMYFDEFLLPDNRVYRLPSTAKKYFDVATKKVAIPTKEVTQAEITEITKDDSKWQSRST